MLNFKKKNFKKKLKYKNSNKFKLLKAYNFKLKKMKENLKILKLCKF